jgi:hypothetical protein
VRVERRDPPRRFEVGWGRRFEIHDCGSIDLDPDEQVTFVTDRGGEYDVTRKDWGFYATPSLNARLVGFKLHAVLVRNKIDRYFVLLVEEGKEPAFGQYVTGEELEIVAWLDDTETLGRLRDVR